MQRRRGALALAALLAGALGSRGLAAATSPSAPEAMVGRWMGTATDTGAHAQVVLPIDLEIQPGQGGLTLVDHDRMRGSGDAAPLVVEGRRISGHYKGLWPSAIHVEGLLSPDGRTLTVTMSGDGMTGLETHVAVLHRGVAAAWPFARPRLDEAGHPQTTYSYREPRAANDGLPIATPEQVGLRREPLEHLVREVLAETDDRAAHHTESVLLLRHGKLVLDEYFWGQSRDNPHIISSATKSISSIMAGLAYDKGDLPLDKPVYAFFPDRPRSLWVQRRYPITVRNVLSMSSGTDFDRSPSDPNSFDLLRTHDVVGLVLGVKAEHPAGADFNYDNGLPSMMGPLISRVTKTPYATLADEALFQPLGIRNYRWTMMPEGVPLSAGGLYLRPRDMAKIGQMMLDDGQWNGRRVVSKRWVEESTRQQTAAGQYPYGFYWHLTNAQQRHVASWDGYMAIGQGGQIIGVFPAQDIVVVMTSSDWATSTPRGSMNAPFDLISRYIVAALPK